MAKTKGASTKQPTKLSIRSYQVGFGDCFLVTFHYPVKSDGTPDDRHVLIDFGSTGKPASARSLADIAHQISADCGGKLTAIVATHRHADHISGFATNTAGDAPGDVIRKLKPDLVMQPWTEHPDADKEATSLANTRMTPDTAFGPARFVAGLNGMHAVAQSIQDEVKRLGPSLSKSVSAQLSFLGEANLKNLPAVKNLMAMGKTANADGKPGAEYLCYGDKTHLQKLLPGVKVHVLGPPTPKQYPEVAKQRSKDASEFWQIMGVSSANMSGAALNPFPDAPSFPVTKPPLSARWLIGRIRALHGAQRLGLVRALDDAMNNTSLILLFEVGGKRFLFPGDAQLENWSYALKDAPEADDNQKLLAGTDFYKVGHHGSLNATPKTLWNLFKKRSEDENKRGRMFTAVSTMAGKHGSDSAKTEVPRKTLVQALESESNFSTTQDLRKASELSNLIEFKLK